MNEELRIVIRAELEQFVSAFKSAKQQFKDFANEGRKASKEMDGLVGELNQQSKALTELKQNYINLAAAHGKESKAAKDAAEQIKKLSTEYKNNKLLATDLANSANSFDMSLGGDKSSENVDKTNASMEELQGTMENIRSLNFMDVLFEALGPELRSHIGKAKAEFEEMGIHARYAFSGLFKNGSYYKETGEQWTGFGDAIKGSFESAGEAGKTFGRGMKEIGTATSKALSGIAGVLLVIIADLAIMIGLTKNALSVAKEIKAEAAAASKIGLETDTYGEWAYVLKQVGVEADKLSDFMKTLTEEQNAVRDGSEDMIKAFEGIGLSAEEVMGSSQEELFKKTVAGLQNVENASERTSLAYKIFGEDAAELANILYLNNNEVQSLINNYNNLAAAPSENLVQQSKILEGSTTNLSYAWQGLKNTLAEWVMPLVIKIVQWLTTAVAYINVFLQGVFGIDLGLGKAADKGAEGMDKFNNGVQEGIKNTEKLKRITMGFDELNVVSDPNKSASGSGSGAGAGGAFSSMGINPELPVIEVPDMTEFKEFMNEYGSMIQGILTWSLIGIGVLLAVLGFMSGNIPLGLLGISLAGLGIGVGAAGGEDSHWNKLGQAIMDILSTIGQFFVDVWNWIVDVWKGIPGFFAGLWEGIKKAFAAVGQWFSDVFTAAWNGIVYAWNGTVDFFAGLWDGIKGVFNSVGGWFSNIFTKAWSGIKTAWNATGTFFSDVWKGIKKPFASVGSWFKDTFKKAWQGVKDVFSTGGKIFDGIKEGIAGVFTTVVNGIIKGINKVVAVPFNSINDILNGIRSIDILGIKPFEGLWGKNPLAVPQIPLLAKGGIVDSATLAVIGERGKEAVVPLENNTEWMDKLAARLGNNSPSRIVLMVDGKELGYAAINSINGITRQTGELQLVLV